MEANDGQLLRRFAETRDEDAFATLVRRHLGLVLGVAQRRLGGQRHAAEDLAQQVFVRLAAKAHRLVGHRCLEGWLHTATRLACLEHSRQEARRSRREQEAAMNRLESGGESSWAQLAPILDDALAALAEKDRNLILMRHVCRRSSLEVASQLGVSEPAARKQLERAMTRLREQLARRGVAVGAVALAASLELQAQAQVSPALVAQVAGHAVPHACAASATAWWSLPKFAMGLGVAALLLCVTIPILKANRHATPQADLAVAPQPVAETEAAAATTAAGDSVVGLPVARLFTLQLSDAETGEPVSGAMVTFWRSPDGNAEIPLPPQLATNGAARVVWTNDCLRFMADVACEGYAYTRIEWVREQGLLPVPESWTLALEPALAIGGVVVDPEGSPVASATVQARASARSLAPFFLPVPGTHQPQISHPFRRMTDVKTLTDAEGRWTLRCLGRRVQDAGLQLWIEHPEYKDGYCELDGGNPSPALLAGEHREVLVPQSTAQIIGVVLDAAGQPLPGARVTDGTLFSNPNSSVTGDQHLKTDAQGGFAFSKRPGWNGRVSVSAKAPGYAAKTVEWSGQPVTIKLEPGRTLRLRVVDAVGMPIEGVRVESHSFEHTGGPETNRSTCYRLSDVTDADGRISWDDVPNEPLLLSFYSDLAGYQSRCGEVVSPSEAVQTFSLDSALKVIGSVTDAETGEDIALFRVARVDAFASGEIPKLRPFALPDTVSGQLFESGEFELSLKPLGGPLAPSLRGPRELARLGVFLKITATGYAAQTTRFLDAREGEVRLQIRLRRAATTRIQVLSETGFPAVGADVVVCGDAGQLTYTRGDWKAEGDYVLTTGADGLFELPADDSVKTVLVQDRDRTALGWADVETLRREGTLRLSRLCGLELALVTVDGTSVGKGQYAVKLTSPVLKQRAGDLFPIFQSNDAEGNCSFRRLPPGTYEVALSKCERISADKVGLGPAVCYTVELPEQGEGMQRYVLQVGSQ